MRLTAAALAPVALMLDGVDVSGDGPMRDGPTLVAVALVFALIDPALPGPGRS
ncbi:hypothetical protein [Glycomyces algeriensis]|uniref:Uncharacterized protein n=1 Tax=Glycomyces algeriensis TaxID=256037 RepID=A0A9W6GE50_9ACTN|nr:hypothetical protein [Glycomyces algeriensis]MDA1368591.1 hypothetical protein [Glycomyces algeriensis]MDR7352390.1 hypothetical protein [Glycomyces algeriensis]GLI45127.1 hypothetical protein GALLR39Z86_49770 [Glycomyces algeriensis]